MARGARSVDAEQRSLWRAVSRRRRPGAANRGAHAADEADARSERLGREKGGPKTKPRDPLPVSRDSIYLAYENALECVKRIHSCSRVAWQDACFSGMTRSACGRSRATWERKRCDSSWRTAVSCCISVTKVASSTPERLIPTFKQRPLDAGVEQQGRRARRPRRRSGCPSRRAPAGRRAAARPPAPSAWAPRWRGGWRRRFGFARADFCSSVSLGSPSRGDDLVVGLGVLPREAEELGARELAGLGDRPDRVVRRGVLLLREGQRRDHLGERRAHGAGRRGRRASAGRRRVRGEGVQELLERELRRSSSRPAAFHDAAAQDDGVDEVDAPMIDEVAVVRGVQNERGRPTFRARAMPISPASPREAAAFRVMPVSVSSTERPESRQAWPATAGSDSVQQVPGFESEATATGTPASISARAGARRERIHQAVPGRITATVPAAGERRDLRLADEEEVVGGGRAELGGEQRAARARELVGVDPQAHAGPAAPPRGSCATPRR